MQCLLSRRRLLGGLAAVGSVSLLAACGGGTTSATASASSAVTSSAQTASPATSNVATSAVPTSRATTSAAPTPASTTSSASTSARAATGTGSTSATSSVAPAATTAASGVQAVTLGWTSWAVGVDLQRTQKQADTFMQRFPTIKIDVRNVECCDPYYNKLQADLAAGAAPDVYRVVGNYYASYALKGSAKVLDPFIARAGSNAFTAKMYPFIVEGSKLDGKIYGVPMGADTQFLQVNETLFKNAGIPLPPTDWNDPSWTWDKFVEVATSLTKRTGDKAEQYGLAPTWWGVNGPLGSVITMNGGAMFDPTMKKVTLDQKPALSAIQWVADLVTKYRVIPVTAEERKAFDFATSGKAAMLWDAGSSYVTRLEHDIAGKFDYNVYPLPHPAGSQPHAFFAWSYWLIDQHTQHPDEAWEFANYLTTSAGTEPEAADGFTAPMLQGPDSAFLKNFPGIHKQVEIQALSIATPWRFPVGYAQMDDTTYKGLSDLVYTGKGSAAEAVATLQPVLQATLDSAKP